MTRNLKALGLALAAVLAMSALSAAQAQAMPTFTGYETPWVNHVHTFLEGTTDSGNVEKFKAGAGTVEDTVECHTKYSGTDLTGDTSTLTITVTEVKTPNTEGTHCNTHMGAPINGNFKTEIEFTSCDYLYHLETRLEADTYTGSVDVKCTAPGDSIHIRITNAGGTTKCMTTIPEQAGLKHIVFHNKKETKPTKVTVTAAVTGIHYTQTEGGILGCGQVNSTYKNGTYTGEAIVEGSNTSGEKIDIEVSGEWG